MNATIRHIEINPDEDGHIEINPDEDFPVRTIIYWDNQIPYPEQDWVKRDRPEDDDIGQEDTALDDLDEALSLVGAHAEARAWMIDRQQDAIDSMRAQVEVNHEDDIDDEARAYTATIERRIAELEREVAHAR